MLQIIVPGRELFDEDTLTFTQTSDTCLKLEHSLLSISKWESKWCKPFLGRESHSPTEMLDYIRCMTLNSVPKEVYNALTEENMRAISDYINSPMSASKVYTSASNTGKKETVTSELIYYWMVTYQIPFECEKWHINRLLMLIQICNAKNNTKKMSRQEILAQNRALNKARRKALHTKG